LEYDFSIDNKIMIQRDHYSKMSWGMLSMTKLSSGKKPLAEVKDPALRRQLELLELTISKTSSAPIESKDTAKRPAPANDNQPDFFVPAVQDVPIKDGLDLMDIAVFRLAKSQTRKGDIIRHELPGVTITVAGGAHGMATIMDYDVVLMMVSHLAEQTRLHRQGRAPEPAKFFHPSSVEIFKFCRVNKNAGSYDMLAETLRRLQGTFIEIATTDTAKRSRERRYFPLIAGGNLISEQQYDGTTIIEIIIPKWIYDAVTSHTNPEVLTLDPGYFLLKNDLARFIYRFARKAAGTGQATCSFAAIHARSGTTRPLDKFTHDLRALISANPLPSYDLTELAEADGPQLQMRCRAVIMSQL
jgi:plasmid replication initiation protein